MRNLCAKTIIISLNFVCFHAAQAELIFPINNVTVTKELTTNIEFDQSVFKNYPKTTNLKLRVMEGNKLLREDAILNKNGLWTWNKVVPFSENLRLFVLKDNQLISGDYFADTKSSLTFVPLDHLPTRAVIMLPAVTVTTNNEKKAIPIAIPAELKNCKDKVLVVVFDKETNTLLWQYYNEFKNKLIADEIEFSKNRQPTIAVIKDDESCGK